MQRRELFKNGIRAGLGIAVSPLVPAHLAGAAVTPKKSAIPVQPSPLLEYRLFSRANSQGQTELALSRKGPWTPVAQGDTFAGMRVLSVSAKAGDRSWTVLERDEATDGEFFYVEQSGVACRVTKPLGKVGMQEPRAIEARSQDYWERLLKAEDDILGKEYLADPRDPSLERTREFLPPLIYPETYIGMKEYPHKVAISWDGSIGIERGFFNGVPGWSIRSQTGSHGEQSELGAALPFALNGREIDRSEAMQVFRMQLESSLPITQYIYQRPADEAGWEQIAFMGKLQGKPAIFLRFRIVNFSATAKTVEFAIHAPLDGKLEPQPDNKTVAITAPTYTTDMLPPPISESQATLTSEHPFKMANGFPVWALSLAPGEHKDLHFVLPGYCASGALSVDPGQVRDAFYEALKGECELWQAFFQRGAQFEIPEQSINEISRGALAKCLVCVNGDEPGGGALWYQGFWPYCTIYLSQVLLELGYFSEVRRYIAYFLKTRIEPNGKINTGWNKDANHQIFDAGYFLKLLACYYWYSQDTSLYTENIQQIDKIVGFLHSSREESLKAFSPDDPRYGMVKGILSCDWWRKPPDYYYTNDGPIWEGLRDYAQMLQDIGVSMGRYYLVTKGKALAQYAKEYHAILRRSLETAKEHNGNKLTYIHVHPILGNPKRPVQCIYLTNAWARAQRRFHDSPRLAGSDLLTDEERRCVFDFEFNHDQTVLGVRRYGPSVLDNFQCYNSAFQKLRLGMVREYLMEYYGTIQALLGPGLWSGFEQTQVIPLDGEKGRRNGHGKYCESPRLFGLEGAHPTWPIVRLTKQIFAFDEPDGDAVWIGRGIPRHWLASGRPVSASRLPTRYGKLDIRYVYRADVRLLTVELDPLERRFIPELRIGARDPEGGSLQLAHCRDASIGCRVDKEKELIIVTGVDRPIFLEISFSRE